MESKVEEVGGGGREQGGQEKEEKGKGAMICLPHGRHSNLKNTTQASAKSMII